MVDFLWRNSEVIEASMKEILGCNKLLIMPSAPHFTNNQEISSDEIKVIGTLYRKHIG